jgi:calcineurin-like phosphoesterase family protein/fibronectin type III domain protein
LRKLTPPLVLTLIALAAAAPSSADGAVRLKTTFLPTADAHVVRAHPKRNFGHARWLRVGRAYLRFNVRTLRGRVIRATLRVYALNGSRRGYAVRAARGSWGERRLAYVHRPRLGVVVGRSGRVRRGSWTTVDVTRLVRRKRLVSLALTGRGGRALRLASRERGRRAPHLVIRTRAASRGGGAGQPDFPIRAAFYYPWYPETWTVNDRHPHASPSLGHYRTADLAIQHAHLRALEHARMDAAISSWWGRTKYHDARLRSLMRETVATGSPLKWAIYYEPEGGGDPSPAELATDLAYIRDTLAASPAYLRVGGKPVVFVWNEDDTSCPVAARWKQANALVGNAIYFDLKIFHGFKDCAAQPSSWHQYAPVTAASFHAGSSYTVSPGFWRADEASPRLRRNLARWRDNVRDMVASRARWQLVTTFNEWGEGTATESAKAWATRSGQGAYLDALHTAIPPSRDSRDRRAPSAPAALSVSARRATSVSIRWSRSADNVRVTGYRVYLDGVAKGTVGGTTYTASGLACGTTHQLGVQARDAAGNVSKRVSVATSTTACEAGSGLVFEPTADAYVKSDAPSSNYGTSAQLRADASPTVLAYLRFAVSDVSGSVERATLRLRALSNLSGGLKVRGSSGGWTEADLTYANAPGVAATATDGIAGAITADTWVSLDVTPLVAGNGVVELAVTSDNSTAIGLASRETPGFAPQLVVETSGGSGPAPEPPPSEPSPSGGGGDPVIAGAGDISPQSQSTSNGDYKTAQLLDAIDPDAVLTFGDNQYEQGTLAQYNSYYAPDWGRHLAKTYPSVGNHEYQTPGAAGYFDYFADRAGDRSKGYYAYDLGEWRLYALNSNCTQVGGCQAGSAQEAWLRNDLAANPRTCVLAYFHHPRYSSGQHGSTAAVEPIWATLAASGADVVLSGHDHSYERFAPNRGIRQLVVGTGGKSHYPIGTPLAGSEVRNDDTSGVLRMVLHPTSYEWQFVPEAGKLFTDSGATVCS